jgi:mRNA-degrading endonuclease RelE of RelBE toxin-antitoxin system
MKASVTSKSLQATPRATISGVTHVIDPDRPRIVKAMLTAEDNPHPQGYRKLFDDIYRIRVGDYV